MNPREFELPSPPAGTWMTLAAIWAAVLASTWLRPHPHAATAGYAWSWMVPVFATALVVVGPFVWMQRRRVAIDDGRLVVQAGMQTRKFDIDGLDLEQARVIDLGEHTEFKPMLKLAGVSLPGLRYGSFLLRNRRRAFCLLIGDDRTLLLPLHAAGKGKESLVLLGPARPQALLEALREEQARRAR